MKDKPVKKDKKQDKFREERGLPRKQPSGGGEKQLPTREGNPGRQRQMGGGGRGVL